MKREHAEQPGLQQCLDLLLPWLPPADLAAAAATCQFFRRAVVAVTARRTADAARGLERHSIPFLNSIDSQAYAYFIYTRFPLVSLPSSPPPTAQPWGYESITTPVSDSSSLVDFVIPVIGSVEGCECVECDEDNCACWDGKMETASECGAGCRCGSECRNRATQQGILVRLRIIKHSKKGWGLHAVEFLKKGTFVCEYAGEFLTTEEARKRQRIYDELASSRRLSPALLIVREHLPSGKACLRVNIDATKVGNVARFINHSCDGGNLLVTLVRNSGSLLPRLCFFAKEDIQEGEELTFCYGYSQLRQNGQPCNCGTAVCSGTLPSEET